MGILSWIIVGGIAGWIAGLIMKGSGSGIFMNIVIGIVGAFVGGLIMNLLGDVGVTGFNIWSLLVAVLGSVVLLGIVGLFRRGRA
ncbi:MAG: GlsB/YeaQ/YmgE family stress response membrane protein [Oscillospiraceae bacterium]